MYSKTLILSSQNKYLTNSPRAILTLFNSKNSTSGKIRLYNLDKLNNSVKIGVYYNEQVLSTNLRRNDDCYEFNLEKLLDLNNNVYCALIDTENSNQLVLCGGSFSGFYFTDEQIAEVSGNFSPLNDEDEELEEVIDNAILNEETKEGCINCEDNCKQCMYKEYFYAHQKNVEIENLLEKTDKLEETRENVEEVECLQTEKTAKQEEQKNNSKETEQFLTSIKEQLDEMFKEYPLDEQIMNIIPNSKIIKVTDAEDTNYILGIMYEDEEIKYLVYGVPARYNSPAPKELGNDYQWLPLDPEDALSDGYYLIYQDASNGKVVPIKVE